MEHDTANWNKAHGSVDGTINIAAENKEDAILLALAASLVTLESFFMAQVRTDHAMSVLAVVSTNAASIAHIIGKTPQDLMAAVNQSKERIAGAAMLARCDEGKEPS